MSETEQPSVDIVARLRKACVGHPYAEIPWPHRVLHEGADEIERLRAELSTWSQQLDVLEATMQAAYDSKCAELGDVSEQLKVAVEALEWLRDSNAPSSYRRIAREKLASIREMGGE